MFSVFFMEKNETVRRKTPAAHALLESLTVGGDFLLSATLHSQYNK